MSSSAMPASLADATRARPALARITQCVLDTWPEHRDYLDVRFGGSGRFHLDFCEEIGGLVLSIAGEELPRFAENYRWTCDRMLEEEYQFSMTGKYRFATFAEVVRGIGLDADYMARYTDGLLVSQLLWANHAHVLSTYLSDFLAAVRPGFSLLEVGPGHGLLLALAAERGVRITGWDLNEASIASTSHA